MQCEFCEQIKDSQLFRFFFLLVPLFSPPHKSSIIYDRWSAEGKITPVVFFSSKKIQHLTFFLSIELEEESPVINWSLELGTRLDSRLYALWNRTAGDCLLDSVLQATWGIYDKDSVLRKTLHDSLHDCSHW